MALGPGISYRDWVNKINDVQQFGAKEINLTLTSGTELIDIKNMITPRIKEISRITPIQMSPTLFPPSNISYGVTLNLEMTNTGRVNIYDGYRGMTVGSIAVAGHNLSLDSGGDPNDIYIEIYLKTSSGTLIASEGFKTTNSKFNDKSIYLVLSQVYTEVYKVDVNIITKAELLNSNFEIGRLWIGNYLEECFDAGLSYGHVDGGKELKSVGNDSFLQQKPNRKEMSFDFGKIDETEAFGTGATWFDLSKTVSTDSDIVVLPRVSTDTELQYLGIYGKLTRPVKIKHLNGPYYESKLDVIELV